MNYLKLLLLVEIIFVFTHNETTKACLGPCNALKLVFNFSARELAKLKQIPRVFIAETININNVILGHVFKYDDLIHWLKTRNLNRQLLTIGWKLVQFHCLMKDTTYFPRLGHQTCEMIDKCRGILQVDVNLAGEKVFLFWYNPHLVAYFFASVQRVY